MLRKTWGWIFGVVARWFKTKPADDNETNNVSHKPVVFDEETSGWTAEELFHECDAALEALKLACHPTRKFVSKYKKWGANDIKYWAADRALGPYIHSPRRFPREAQAVTPIGLPHSILMGAPTVDYFGDSATEEERQKAAYYVFFRMMRLTNLPMQFSPTGPGWAYEVEAIYVEDGGHGKGKGSIRLQDICTIDRNGVGYPAARLRQNSMRVGPRSRPSHVTLGNVWRVPDTFSCLRDHKTPVGQELNRALQIFVPASAYQDMAMLVSASDSRGVVRVALSAAEAKIIFKKRIKVATESGRTRPIFHWVASHRRITGANVKTHTRGLTSFDWNGMRINITMPERDTSIRSEMPAITEVKEFPWQFQKQEGPTMLENPFSGEKFEIYSLSKIDKHGTGGRYYSG